MYTEVLKNSILLTFDWIIFLGKVNLVDFILKAKKQNIKTDTSSLETQIDDEVYKLYSITTQEKNIIEANE